MSFVEVRRLDPLAVYERVGVLDFECLRVNFYKVSAHGYSFHGLLSKKALANPGGVMARKAERSSFIPVYLKVVRSRSAFEGRIFPSLMLGHIPRERKYSLTETPR